MNNQPGYLLVVEDIPDILNLMDAALTFKGYRVGTARNGVEALEAVDQERPLIVITDILMPKMDGFNLLHRLRINPKTRNIPVVFLSATYIAPEDKDFALTVGATRFIEKPIDLEKFMQTISEILVEGTHRAEEPPLNESDFYEGYSQRLKIKLDHKSSQITRIERIIGTVSGDEKQSFMDSLMVAVNEQKEIRSLLEQVQEWSGKVGR